jgi:hypothetical protein
LPPSTSPSEATFIITATCDSTSKSTTQFKGVCEATRRAVAYSTPGKLDCSTQYTGCVEPGSTAGCHQLRWKGESRAGTWCNKTNTCGL